MKLHPLGEGGRLQPFCNRWKFHLTDFISNRLYLQPSCADFHLPKTKSVGCVLSKENMEINLGGNSRFWNPLKVPKNSTAPAWQLWKGTITLKGLLAAGLKILLPLNWALVIVRGGSDSVNSLSFIRLTESYLNPLDGALALRKGTPQSNVKIFDWMGTGRRL